jgi:ArsR family transcriptional regulator, arsenate/arsenite/antimonite-responsive transcriptional repressor
MKKNTVLDCLAALSQETRLDIFRLLVQAGPEGVAAGQIGERLEVALPTLSFHLNQLRQAGLIEAERNGRSIIYRADYDAMNGLLGYLTDNCCRGQPEECGLPACKPATPIVAIGASDEAPARPRRRQGSR